MTDKEKSIKPETNIENKLYLNYGCKDCPIRKGKCKK